MIELLAAVVPGAMFSRAEVSLAHHSESAQHPELLLAA
jgi:hypothetical protein